jgi:hypothetical protein
MLALVKGKATDLQDCLTSEMTRAQEFGHIPSVMLLQVSACDARRRVIGLRHKHSDRQLVQGTVPNTF